MILYTFGPAFNVPDPSPFPVKVMMFMRMHNIEFQKRIGDMRKAPLKKIPYLECETECIPDSELILNYLENKFSIKKDNLSIEQHAIGNMVCRTLEERTYWCSVYFRWLGEHSFPVLRDTLLTSVPSLLRGFIGSIVQKKIRKSLYAQGIGRHSEDTISAFVREDFKALSDLIGDKAYLFGDKPTRYDCSAAGLVCMFAAEGLPTGGPKVLEEFPNLKAYWQRVKTAYFQE